MNVTGDAGRGAVLLLHGVRSYRRSMLSRAIFLHDIGYSVLLINLQAHGESAGKRITLGYLESRDVVAAREFLRRT
jgi:alpha-beta hydrolase superfamily lysophospholipase